MSRFEKKIDGVFWFIIAILPLIIYLINFFHTGASTTNFTTFLEPFKFDFIANLLNNIFIDNYSLPIELTNYLSWFCAVEIVHILVDAVLFVPRFAHKVLARFSHD